MLPKDKETVSGQGCRPPVTVYLGLGSNMGDSRANLQRAVALLDLHPEIKVERVSPFLETAPVGYLEQPHFLNGVLQATTTLSPQALLAAAQSIENRLGRKRTVRWGPRTIDIDILLYGDLVLKSADLTIPHPRMQERAFVLQPLALLAPELRLPGCLETVGALAQKLAHPAAEK